MPGTLVSLIIAGLAFHGSHVTLSSTRLRGTLREQLGERGYLALYSGVALATLAWFVSAYRVAPIIALWPLTPGLALVPVAIVPFSCILVIAGLTTPNPTAVGMERAAAADDPAPGILRVTRHPVMWGGGLWALGHLVANGDLASLIFFGSLAGLALGGTWLIDRKKRLALGTNWARLAEVTSNLPFLAILGGRTRLPIVEIGPLRIIAGLLLYAVLFLAHPLIAGRPILWP